MTTETIVAAPPSVPLSLDRAAWLERLEPDDAPAYVTFEGERATVTLGFTAGELTVLALGCPTPGVRHMLSAVAFLTGGRWTADDRLGLAALARAALRGTP